MASVSSSPNLFSVISDKSSFKKLLSAHHHHSLPDFIFLAIDSLGAVFGLASLVVQPEFDALGISDFIAILVGEGVVFLAQPLWLYRTRATRRKARSAGQTYDEYVSHLETPEETEREPESVESPISPGSIAVGFEKVLETV